VRALPNRGRVPDLAPVLLLLALGAPLAAVRAATPPELEDSFLPSRLGPTASGLQVRFPADLDVSLLNLHHTGPGGLGPADVLVDGPGGAVAGSLLVDGDGRGFEFVATGGPLPPGAYTFTLRGAADGIVALDGRVLDGDLDGAPGGDLSFSVTVAAVPSRTLAVADVVRGPGQALEAAVGDGYLALTLGAGPAVDAVVLDVRYDPAVLAPVVSAGAGLPGGATLLVDDSVPGRLAVDVDAPAGLGTGALELLRLTGTVRSGAPYGVATALRIESVALASDGTPVPARGDVAVHLAAFPGDATRDGVLGHDDGDAILRNAVRLDVGLPAWPRVDPLLVADLTGNGSLGALDANRVYQFAAGLDPGDIPPVPSAPAPASSAPAESATSLSPRPDEAAFAVGVLAPATIGRPQ
jgi:hypothetical protein